jgi:predicted DNA-binding transcriptional regulator AlpA
MTATTTGDYLMHKDKGRLERLTLDIDDIAPLLGINRSTAFELIRRDEFPLPVVRLGRRIVVPRKAVEELLGDVTGGSASGDDAA